MQSDVIEARAKRMRYSDMLAGYKPSAKVKNAAAKARAQGPVRDPIPPEAIPRAYEGATAVLFATGPSLTEDVVNTVLEARKETEIILFGCNDAYSIVPALDVHYACDSPWWHIHYHDVVESVAGDMWTQEPHMSKSRFPGLRRVKGTGRKGLSSDQNLIHFGNNSGYQLINVAYLYGIKKMILCGYNMSVVNNKRHFFGDHPPGLNRSGNYTGFAKVFTTIKPEALGIEIVNATPHTALTAFPKVELADALR